MTLQTRLRHLRASLPSFAIGLATGIATALLLPEHLPLSVLALVFGIACLLGLSLSREWRP